MSDVAGGMGSDDDEAGACGTSGVGGKVGGSGLILSSLVISTSSPSGAICTSGSTDDISSMVSSAMSSGTQDMHMVLTVHTSQVHEEHRVHRLSGSLTQHMQQRDGIMDGFCGIAGMWKRTLFFG